MTTTQDKNIQVNKGSVESYDTLKEQLGKEFVDKALFNILGFDKTLDIATNNGETGEYNTGQVPQEIQNILSDKESTITLARQKVNKEINKRYTLYFHALNKEDTTMDTLIARISAMLADIEQRVTTISIEDLYYDFAFLFSFSGNLKWDHKNLFGEYIDDPRRDMKMHLKETEFRKHFLSYLKSFFQRIDNAAPEDKKKIYFISELLRRQSGERDGIGNTMNPMIQNMTLDDMFGSRHSRNIKGIVPKIIFKIKKNTPGTEINTRKKIGDELEKIVRTYLFPKEYYKR